MSYIFAIILSVVIVAVDQLSKYFIASTYTLGESFPIIEGLFNMTYIHNRGAAFGVLQNQRWFFLAITAIVGFFIFHSTHKSTRFGLKTQKNRPFRSG